MKGGHSNNANVECFYACYNVGAHGSLILKPVSNIAHCVEAIGYIVIGHDDDSPLTSFIQEMADDDLILPGIEMAIAHGRIHRRFTRDPRGTRYEIVGPTIAGRAIAVMCRIKSTGKLLLITTYALE